MASKLYAYLSGIGYHHPLHPVLTHLPVGLIIGSFVFMALAYFLKSSKYAKSAKHCMVLALLALIPTVIVGFLDWQHFYGGASLFPIKMKLNLAAVLTVLLSAAVYASVRCENKILLRMLVHLLSLFAVAGVGYYGGELVYGKKTSAIQNAGTATVNAEMAERGQKLFEKSCSFCHYSDSTDSKVGPGLKGLSRMEKMPVSGWPVSDDNLLRQLKTPFGQMPPFEGLTDEDVNALIFYLKSL